MEKEPLWRKVLCWGSVTTFLAAPWLVLILHMAGWLDRVLISHELPYLKLLYISNSALLMGLAGLNTFSLIKTNGKAQSLERPNT